MHLSEATVSSRKCMLTDEFSNCTLSKLPLCEASVVNFTNALPETIKLTKTKEPLKGTLGKQ